MGSNFGLCVIVSRDYAFLDNVLHKKQFWQNHKKMRKEEREKKKVVKLLKCSTVNNPVRENSSDDGIEICYQDDTTSW